MSGQQLALWDASAPATPDFGQNPPLAGVPQRDDAIKIIEDPTAVAAPAAAVLRHPQANRQARLEGAQVAYVLRRARRRSIGFRVDEEGLSVRAPMAASMQAIEAALQAKAGWIVRKLADQQAYQQRLQGTRIAWGDAAVLPYLGAPLAVVLQAPDGAAGRGAQLLAPQPGQGARLYVPLARSAQPAQVRDAVQAWLQRQARLHFTQRLDHFAPQLGVRWTRLGLSSARTRWGSARADGSIRLNWRLLHFSPEVIDYVVVHELSHLRVMDHSPRFWDVVQSVVPDWPQLRQRLREEPVPPWG